MHDIIIIHIKCNWLLCVSFYFDSAVASCYSIFVPVPLLIALWFSFWNGRFGTVVVHPFSLYVVSSFSLL